MATPIPEQYIELKSGAGLIFEPDSRFNLPQQASVIVGFKPDWQLDAGADPIFGACVLQIGSKTSPGAVLDVRASLDMQSLLLSSGDTDTVTVKMDLSKGGLLGLFFSGAVVRVALIKTSVRSEQNFSLGKLSIGDAQLRLGGSGGNKPFLGMIGSVMLFDRDIHDDLVVSQRDSHALRAWLFGGKPEDFFALCGAEGEGLYVKSLIGVAVPRQNRFDFIPRDILWPQGEPNRWVLENGHERPMKVTLANADRPDEHGVYTSNNIYCFARFSGKPYLWSDAGSVFELAYQGNNRFTGKGPGGRVLKLTHTAQTLFPYLASIKLDCDGWDNTRERIFATRVCPAGATVDVPTAELWPSTLRLMCLPRDYKVFMGETSKDDTNSQSVKDAFAKISPATVASMEGWDVLKINNPLNPANSAGTNKDPSDYLFQWPTGIDFRMEWGSYATPYYCAIVNIVETDEVKTNTAYRSSSEFTQQQSQSFGVGLDVGQESLFDFSLKNERKSATGNEAEHGVVVSHTTALQFAAVLEKQWLKLNAQFVNALKQALDDIPAALPLGNESAPEYGSLKSLFGKWGTHYANAITYGTAEYSLGLVDDVSAMQMASDNWNTSVGVGIPIDAALAKGKYEWGSEDGKQNKNGLRSEVLRNKTVGSHEIPVPIRMDLRPITDLLQPPYIAEEWVLNNKAHILTAWNGRFAENRKTPADGFVLYQARVKSVENLWTEGVNRVCARVFLSGVVAHDDGGFNLWVNRDPNKLTMAFCDTLDVPAGRSFVWTPGSTPQFPFATLSVGIRDTSYVVPSVCITGSAVQTRGERVRAVLPGHQVGGGWSMDPSGNTVKDPVDVTPATDDEVYAAESKIIAAGLKPVDTVGISGDFGASLPAQSRITDSNDHRLVEFREIVKFPNSLPDDGTLVNFTIEAPGIRWHCEARKIDIAKLFSGESSAAAIA